MPESAVADTGPLIHLNEVDHLHTLCTFAPITISQHVRADLRRHRILDAIVDEIADQLRVVRVTLNELRRQRDRFASSNLHQADLSTAVLADRLRPGVVLTDDLRLRRALESVGCVVVGSVGVLVRGLHSGEMTRDSLLAAIDRLFDDSTLHTSAAFRQRVREWLGAD